MRPYLWEIRPYFRQVAGQLALGSLAGMVMNTAIVLPAILLGQAIDAVRALERGEIGPDAVAWAAMMYVGGVLATEGPRVLKRWWLMTANARIRANIRADCLRGVFRWPMARLHGTPVGDVMARIIGDVEVLGVGVREFTIELWDTVLFSISLVVAMLVFDAPLALMALAPVPLAMWLAHAAGRWVQGRTTAAREANAVLTTAIQEQLAGIRVLRLFGRRSAAIDQVHQRSEQFARTNLATIRLKGGLQPVYTMLMTAGVVLVVWQGGLRVLEGAMTLGAFVAFLELYLRFVNRGFRVPQLVNSVQTGGAAYARLKPLLAPALSVHGEPRHASFMPGHVAGLGAGTAQAPTEPERVLAKTSTKRPPIGDGPIAVDFEGVTFRYPGTEVPTLREVSLRLPAGALVGITGPVGSGKSALARALLGLYPLEAGCIRLAGVPLESLASEERARRLGYLPQEGYLFSGTIAENVLLGLQDQAQAQRWLQRAVSLAALEADLRALPSGLATQVGELGMRVSGGQRQRISLARAVATPAAQRGRMPGLLVFDDPFSAVDVDTEVQIVRALHDTFGPAAIPDERATVVLCSHRLAAFPHADLVVVLENGRIVEQGTHAELINQEGRYARIYRAQQRVDAPPVERWTRNAAPVDTADSVDTVDTVDRGHAGENGSIASPRIP